MTFRQAQNYLNSFTNLETHFDASAQTLYLDKTYALLECLGNPQQKIKFIHVAGTKGKGSTSAFIAHILHAAGFKTGFYTSPHLHDIRERIRILDPDKKIQKDFAGAISPKEFGQTLQRLKPAIEKVSLQKKFSPLTYFEILTVMAVEYFAKHNVDFAVMETGLGGRLDATNVVDALVCVLTPMSLEHTQILGKKLQNITKEKVAIVKNPEQIVIVSQQPSEVRRIIQKHCDCLQAKTLFLNEDIRFETVWQDHRELVFTVQIPGHDDFDFTSSLLGPHQAANAAVAVGAVTALKDLGFQIKREAIINGVAQTRWPGRFEIVARNPFVILDGAHNVASMKILKETILALFPKRKVICILGVSVDKDIEGICREVRSFSKTIITTRAQHPRAYDFHRAEWKKVFGSNRVLSSDNVRQAWTLAKRQTTKDDVVLFTGSLFVVGEMRKIWRKPI